jgi:hypothetical protein
MTKRTNTRTLATGAVVEDLPDGRRLTTLPDGRVVASRPPAEGEARAEFPMPWDLGVFLGELFYRARIVVERVDGAPISERDQVVLREALDAAAEHGPSSPRVRDAVAASHLRRAQARLAEREPGATGGGRRAPTKASAKAVSAPGVKSRKTVKRAAAKRP